MTTSKRTSHLVRVVSGFHGFIAASALVVLFFIVFTLPGKSRGDTPAILVLSVMFAGHLWVAISLWLGWRWSSVIAGLFDTALAVVLFLFWSNVRIYLHSGIDYWLGILMIVLMGCYLVMVILLIAEGPRS